MQLKPHNTITHWIFQRCSLQLTLILGLLVILTVVLFEKSYGLVGTSGYFINQSRMEITVDPKTGTASGSVKITSNSPTTIKMKITSKLWTLDEHDFIRYLDPPTTGYNLLDNILINPQEFDLTPGKSRVIRFMVRGPEEIKDAEYQFQLFYEPAESLAPAAPTQPTGQGITQVLTVVPVFSTTVYVYKGNPQPAVQVKNFACTYDPQKSKVLAKLDLENTGLKHARLLGSVIVNQKNAAGQFQPADIKKLRNGSLIFVFPNVTRTEEEAVMPVTKDKPLQPGDYHLELQLIDQRNIQPALNSTCDVTVR